MDNHQEKFQIMSSVYPRGERRKQWPGFIHFLHVKNLQTYIEEKRHRISKGEAGEATADVTFGGFAVGPLSMFTSSVLTSSPL